MLKIFNTLTNKKEIFKSVKKNHLNIYVCGVTVYALCHIGHGRTFVVFDMIIRYFKFLGYSIYYVRNITDVDDKIIKKSIIQKQDYISLTQCMIKEMSFDFSALNLLKPDNEPLVTACINLIIDFIKELLVSKNAYISKNGDVLFSVSNCSEYGKLSNQNINYLQSQTHNSIYHSISFSDFVLWKKKNFNVSKKLNSEPVWDSPWGYGRPGWHIECSAINKYYFNNKIDIHGGGIDLLFPHHENERSQSICINKYESVNYWVHSGLLVIDNKKMSKSLNNDLTLRKMLHNYHPETLRYYFLSTHYRKPLHFYKNSLFKSELSLKKLYYALKGTDSNASISDESLYFKKRFLQAMNDDFNTPKAISILFVIANKIKCLKRINMKKANELSARLRSLGSILGILKDDPNIFIDQKYKTHNFPVYKINLLIKIRNFLRQSNKWTKADAIRNKLLKLGILLQDDKKKTTWSTYKIVH